MHETMWILSEHGDPATADKHAPFDLTPPEAGLSDLDLGDFQDFLVVLCSAVQHHANVWEAAPLAHLLAQ